MEMDSAAGIPAWTAGAAKRGVADKLQDSLGVQHLGPNTIFVSCRAICSAFLHNFTRTLYSSMNDTYIPISHHPRSDILHFSRSGYEFVLVL